MVGINRRSRKYRAFGLRELLLAVIAFYFWLGWYNQYFFSNEESAIAITDVNTISYTFDKEIIQSKWHPVESFHNVMKTNNCRVLKSCIQHYPKCPMGCKCFCDNLCKIQPVSNITRYMTMNNTSSPKDRLIPKIVHQTWKNPVTKEEYPNMSRFVQSWQQLMRLLLSLQTFHLKSKKHMMHSYQEHSRLISSGIVSYSSMVAFMPTLIFYVHAI
jgi:hypothetical protein